MKVLTDTMTPSPTIDAFTSVLDRLGCLFGRHEDGYTDEYAHSRGYGVAEKVCEQCGRRELAWVGPKLNDYPAEVRPTKTREEALDELRREQGVNFNE